MTSENGYAIRDELNSVISAVLAKHETSMVGNWIALVETIDENGERGLWSFASDGAKPWDTVGMMSYAMLREQAGITSSFLREEG